ncbi:unnamed protein product, partial [Urochloa humidicola]
PTHGRLIRSPLLSRSSLSLSLPPTRHASAPLFHSAPCVVVGSSSAREDKGLCSTSPATIGVRARRAVAGTSSVRGQGNLQPLLDPTVHVGGARPDCIGAWGRGIPPPNPIGWGKGEPPPDPMGGGAASHCGQPLAPMARRR